MTSRRFSEEQLSMIGCKPALRGSDWDGRAWTNTEIDRLMIFPIMKLRTPVSFHFRMNEDGYQLD